MRTHWIVNGRRAHIDAANESETLEMLRELVRKGADIKPGKPTNETGTPSGYSAFNPAVRVAR